jgi:hypothetical protein
VPRPDTNDLNPAPASPRRASVEIALYDPGAERATALAHSGALALGTSLAVSIGLATAEAIGTFIGWLLLAGAGLISAVPLIRHTLTTRRSSRRLPVWQLDQPWNKVVTRAADQAARLRALAEGSADGPVADHLHHLALRAEDYVIALYGAAAESLRSEPGTAERRMLETESDRIVTDLIRLADAADRLHGAQFRHLEPSPLTELIEQTEQIAEALETEAGLGLP